MNVLEKILELNSRNDFIEFFKGLKGLNSVSFTAMLFTLFIGVLILIIAFSNKNIESILGGIAIFILLNFPIVSSIYLHYFSYYSFEENSYIYSDVSYTKKINLKTIEGQIIYFYNTNINLFEGKKTLNKNEIINNVKQKKEILDTEVEKVINMINQKLIDENVILDEKVFADNKKITKPFIEYYLSKINNIKIVDEKDTNINSTTKKDKMCETLQLYINDCQRYLLVGDNKTDYNYAQLVRLGNIMREVLDEYMNTI